MFYYLVQMAERHESKKCILLPVLPSCKIQMRLSCFRGCYSWNPSQTCLIIIIISSSFLSPGALSSSPVRHHDTRGGAVMMEAWWICMVLQKCLLNYLPHGEQTLAHTSVLSLQFSAGNRGGATFCRFNLRLFRIFLKPLLIQFKP